MDIFERLESDVRSYSRAWPTVFHEARGEFLIDESGAEYIDFFSGAGTLNYGHNDPAMKRRLIEYIEADGVMHGLDMSTTAKRQFLERLESTILRPRGLDYKVQFPGPTGTNAIEAALKLARKATGREPIYGFANAFHGMTLGAMAVGGNLQRRSAPGVRPNDTPPLPYEDSPAANGASLDEIEATLRQAYREQRAPAAIIVETVQGEGGLHTASNDWLRRLASICATQQVLLIVDDVQAGCGRTGTFFSFEPAQIVPDIVCLSKSISGYGLPLALTLFKRELDVWDPGEHSGTFRGNNAAFVTGAEALRFWETDDFARSVDAKASRISTFLIDLAEGHEAARGTPRGRGLFQGIHLAVPGLAQAVCQLAYDRGLLMETSGPDNDVVKMLPPLTIGDDALDRGLAILEESLIAALEAAPPGATT
jgi:diaminobutyrate-2-oxoglutarate transaminase